MRREDERDAELARRYWAYQLMWDAAEIRGQDPRLVEYPVRLVEAVWRE